MATRVRSFCKINVGLAVGPVRPDGFHGLTTAYQTLALHDLVTVHARPAKELRIVLEANHPGVPCTAMGDGHRNTAYKMIVGALGQLGLQAEVRIEIEKRLPVQGGLGAGSANAVAALLGLERELNVTLPGPARLALAAEVGSDVPLFLLGGTVLGLDRGETVFPLPDSPPLPVVVAVPNVGVSTAQAFRDLDEQMLKAEGSPAAAPPASRLTPPSGPDRLKELSRVLASVWTHTGVGRAATGIADSPSQQPAGGEELLKSSDVRDSVHGEHGNLAEIPGSPSSAHLRAGGTNPLLALVRTGVENDFESVAFRQHPSLRDLKLALLGETTGSPDGASRALFASLSGSGSALFGVYGTIEAAQEAQRRVQALGSGALVTETLPRHEYWQRMFA